MKNKFVSQKTDGRGKNTSASQMRSRSAYWIKLVLIAILLIVAQLVTYLVVLQKYNLTLKSEYEKSMLFNHGQYSEVLSAGLSDIYENFNAVFENEKEYPAFSRGHVNVNRVLTVKFDGKSLNYTMNNSDFINITQSRLSFSTLRYLSAYNIPSDVPLAVMTAPYGNSYRILFFDQTQFLKNSENFGFQSFSVINSARSVVFGKYADAPKTFEQIIFASDLTKEKAMLFGDVRGENGITVLGKLSVQEGFWLIGFLNDSAVVDSLSAVTTDVGLAMLLTLVLSVVFTVAAAIIYTKKQDFIYGYNIASKDFYVVYTDNLGNIKRANPEFNNKYQIKNLFESENLDSNFHQLKRHDNYIIKLKNKEGLFQIVNFLATKTSRGFKFAGVDGADVTDYFSNLIETPFIDKATELYNFKKLEIDYNAFKSDGRRIVGAIKLSNLTLFGTLFGRKFFGQVRQVYANRLKQQFQDIAQVYIISADTFAIYLDNEENIQTFLRDIDKEMSDLNLAVKNGENVVKVVVKAGFVIVDKQIDNQFEYVSECYNATLERAVESNVEYYVYHETQKDFYSKYFNKAIDIDKLLDEKALTLYYQPQLDLKTNKICGFEALLRLKQSAALRVNVFDLIKFAEQSGQMVKLGNFIFEEGMRFAAELNDPTIEISLNVSPLQLMQAGFTDDFIKLFKRFGLKPNTISLEVTESFMMTDVKTAILKFKLLKNSGIDIRLDDFGMGYSSLQYLKRLPISVVKIDREFVKDILDNEYSQSIVKMIIGLTKELKLLNVAEGVENEQQTLLLKSYGCDMIQGYYISKAVPEDAVKQLLYKYNHAEKHQGEEDKS